MSIGRIPENTIEGNEGADALVAAGTENHVTALNKRE